MDPSVLFAYVFLTLLGIVSVMYGALHKSGRNAAAAGASRLDATTVSRPPAGEALELDFARTGTASAVEGPEQPAADPIPSSAPPQSSTYIPKTWALAPDSPKGRFRFFGRGKRSRLSGASSRPTASGLVLEAGQRAPESRCEDRSLMIPQ